VVVVAKQGVAIVTGHATAKDADKIETRPKTSYQVRENQVHGHQDFRNLPLQQASLHENNKQRISYEGRFVKAITPITVVRRTQRIRLKHKISPRHVMTQ